MRAILKRPRSRASHCDDKHITGVIDPEMGRILFAMLITGALNQNPETSYEGIMVQLNAPRQGAEKIQPDYRAEADRVIVTGRRRCEAETTAQTTCYPATGHKAGVPAKTGEQRSHGLTSKSLELHVAVREPFVVPETLHTARVLSGNYRWRPGRSDDHFAQ